MNSALLRAAALAACALGASAGGAGPGGTNGPPAVALDALLADTNLWMRAPADFIQLYRAARWRWVTADVRARAIQMGVAVEPLTDGGRDRIYATIADENMEKIVLEKAPRIAVYIPPDAVP